MKTIKCTCPNCGARVEVEKDYKVLTCPYCGCVLLIDGKTDSIHISKEK